MLLGPTFNENRPPYCFAHVVNLKRESEPAHSRIVIDQGRLTGGTIYSMGFGACCPRAAQLEGLIVVSNPCRSANTSTDLTIRHVSAPLADVGASIKQ